jgi:hypothetical protein
LLEELRDAGWLEKSIGIHSNENVCHGEASSKREERHHDTEEVWRVDHGWPSCTYIEIVEE